MSRLSRRFISFKPSNCNIWKQFFGSKENQSKYVVCPERVSEPLSVPDAIVKPSYWSTGVPPVPPAQPEVKTSETITAMRKSCQLAADIVHSLDSFIKAGVTTDEIDKEVHRLTVSNHAYPSPLNYSGFPKSCCTSVNNVVCHGIPDSRQLVEGDIVNVDVTVYKDGVHGDCSKMYLVGAVDETGKSLCEITLEALKRAIRASGPGVPYGHIGAVIEDFVSAEGLTVIPSFIGHGIGSYFHGPPDIYHFRYPRCYPGVMEAGVTFTIEPAIGEGRRDVVILEDGWTAVTEDGTRAAQWEHTVLITEDGAEVLTQPS